MEELADRCNTLALINPVRYQRLDIYLIKKYVDDCLVALDTMAPGVRWSQVEQAMVWSEEDERADKSESRGNKVSTMTEFANMASGVVSCLRFTFDCPQMNAGGAMPVLDTQMWVGKEGRNSGIPEAILEDRSLIQTKVGILRSVVLYKFYRKPMANQVSNRNSSAIPEQQKVSTTAQEVLRRVKNTSRDLPPEVVEEVLMTYMEELEARGYKEDWRSKVLESAMVGYEKMLRSEKTGQGYVNRPESHTKLKRRWNRLVGKHNWFKTDKNSQPPRSEYHGKGTVTRRSKVEIEGVLYVPYTPQGTLKRSIQKAEDCLLKNSRVGRVRILERLGPKIAEQLCNPTPWTGQHCGREGCHPCRSKEGSCRKSNVTYKWNCMTCLSSRNKKVVYIGETSRSLWDRSQEHQEDLKRRSEKSVLYRHWQEAHKNEAEPEFTVEVIRSHRSATERQIWEALQIQGGKHDELINSKSEWGMNCLVRQETAFDREVRTVNQEAEGNSRATPDPSSETEIIQIKSSFQTQFRQRKKQGRI